MCPLGIEYAGRILLKNDFQCGESAIEIGKPEEKIARAKRSSSSSYIGEYVIVIYYNSEHRRLEKK
jgi:hypothetical protein